MSTERQQSTDGPSIDNDLHRVRDVLGIDPHELNHSVEKYAEIIMHIEAMRACDIRHVSFHSSGHEWIWVRLGERDEKGHQSTPDPVLNAMNSDVLEVTATYSVTKITDAGNEYDALHIDLSLRL